MARKVYSYQSISNLREHPNYSEIVKAPHITAAGYMASAIHKEYGEIKHVASIRRVIRDCIPFWDSKETAFQQYISVNRAIRELKVKPNQELIHESFRKNRRQVLLSIRALIEADVNPDELEPTNDEESIFKEIWWALEESEESINRFRRELDNLETKRKLFERKMEKIGYGIAEADTIVLHGFYYITPLQERFFDILEAHGKTLIFLSHIDSRVEAVNEIWKKTFTEKDYFPAENEWVFGNEKNIQNRVFAAAFDGDKTKQSIKVKVIKYSSEGEFVDDFKRLTDEHFTIFTTDKEKTTELVRLYYPEYFKRRHLLAYPVGQYIYCLHNMWNSENDRIELDMKTLVSCFSSGWLESEGENAVKYVSDLKKIEVFMTGCRTVPEWKERISLLIEKQEQFTDIFEKHIENVPEQTERWHRIMANPMLNFSCFSIEKDRLEKTADFIDKISETAQSLFGNGGEISISIHFSTIRQLLNERNNEKLLDEERAVMSEIVDRLSIRRLDFDKCFPADISDAIMIMIGGGILDEEESEIDPGVDDQIVWPIEQVEGALTTAHRKIHLCFSDESRLPGKRSSYSWPISKGMLENLDMANPERYYRYVADMINVIENSALSKRYLFFTLLECDELEISWIAEEDEKELGPSPYIRILEKITDLPIHEFKRRFPKRKERETSDLGHSIIENNIYIKEREMDYLLCPYKDLYGYLLNDHPYYLTEFHYGFALSKLIGTTAQLIGKTKSDVAKELSTIFRYPRNIEMRQIEDYSTSITQHTQTAMDNVVYTDNRLPIHMLTKSVLEEAENRLENYTDGEESAHLATKEICMYCQFKDDCPHSVIGGDE